jgi:hypothetical protein
LRGGAGLSLLTAAPFEIFKISGQMQIQVFLFGQFRA